MPQGVTVRCNLDAQSKGGCPQCEGRSITPDQSLIAQWDAALGSDIHERNLVKTIYQYNCWLADKEKIEAHEVYMRTVIAKKMLSRLRGL